MINLPLTDGRRSTSIRPGERLVFEQCRLILRFKLKAAVISKLALLALELARERAYSMELPPADATLARETAFECQAQ